MKTDIIDNNSQNGRILTLQEAADKLRLNRSTITRYAQSGKLKSYIVGRRRLIKEADLWEFFENQVDRAFVLGKE